MANDLPKRMRRDDVAELDAAIVQRAFYRLTPEEVGTAQRERWEDTPDEAWFSKWAPLAPGVYRGPYAKPTRAILRDVEAGLRRRLER